MKKQYKWLLGLLAFALVLGLAFFAYQSLSKNNPASDGVSDKPPVSGEQGAEGQDEEQSPVAPDFTVYDAEGAPQKLSDHLGKRVVINFWASWCNPCRMEMPYFEEAYQEYGEEIVFLMVNMVDGGRETQEKGQAFVEENAYTFPVFYDTDAEAAIAYSVNALPSTYLINEKGEIVAGISRAMDKDLLMQGLKLLAPDVVK